MEVWLQRVLLSIILGGLAGNTLAAESEQQDDQRSILDRIISPDIQRREINQPDIDSENFEIGAYLGIMSVEDFGTNAVYGLRFAYHLSEDFFVEAGYGQTTTEETSFELLSGATRILSDDERDLSYYNLSLGYNLLPGEIFFGSKRSFNSSIYLLGGVGNTTFAEDDYFTYNMGVGLRLLPTDWMAIHIDFRGHVFDHELLGEEKTVINLEGHAGLTFFF